MVFAHDNVKLSNQILSLVPLLYILGQSLLKKNPKELESLTL